MTLGWPERANCPGAGGVLGAAPGHLPPGLGELRLLDHSSETWRACHPYFEYFLEDVGRQAGGAGRPGTRVGTDGPEWAGRRLPGRCWPAGRDWLAKLIGDPLNHPPSRRVRYA